MAKDPTVVQTTFLSQLVVTDDKRNAGVALADPKLRARQKLLDGLAEQTRYIEAQQRSETYQPTRIIYIAGSDGQRVKAEAPKRRRPWYWQLANGNWATQILYGASPISFGSGTSLTCGADLASVLATFQIVENAVKAGELDVQLAKAIGARGRGRATQAPESPVAPLDRSKATRATKS